MADIDIILPLFRPAAGWSEIVFDKYSELKKIRPNDNFHLIVVNDGTNELEINAESNWIRNELTGLNWLSYLENRGKGYAIRYGVSHSTSEFIIYTDIDWPYTLESVDKMLNILLDGADAVVGVRDSHYYNQLPAYRRLISKSLRKLNGLLLRLKVSDTQAGLKAFRKDLAPIFMKTSIDRYLFDLEFIYQLSRQKNLKVIPCPIRLREGITFSRMDRQILWQEAKNFLRVLGGN